MYKYIYVGCDSVEYDRICRVLAEKKISFKPSIENIENGFAGNKQIFQIKVKNKDFENAEYEILNSR